MQPRRILLSLLFLAILASLALITKFFVFNFQPQALGALQVNSIPKASVFLTERDMGQTPFSLNKITPGEYMLKLVPTATNSAGVSWETKIKVLPGTLTYVSREIGFSDEMSSDQILTLEKIPSSGKAEVMIVSTPDQATVAVDGLEKGKTSVVLRQIPTGDHVIVVSLPGFNDQIIRANLTAGYRLNAVVKLSKATPTFDLTKPRPTEELITATSGAEMAKPYVVVKNTPVGYLNVRLLPSVTASEAGKIRPGEKYPFVSQSDNWVQIQLSSGKGWVVEDYVEINR